jgi:hypothetical protein
MPEGLISFIESGFFDSIKIKNPWRPSRLRGSGFFPKPPRRSRRKVHKQLDILAKRPIIAIRANLGGLK